MRAGIHQSDDESSPSDDGSTSIGRELPGGTSKSGGLHSSAPGGTGGVSRPEKLSSPPGAAAGLIEHQATARARAAALAVLDSAGGVGGGPLASSNVTGGLVRPRTAATGPDAKLPDPETGTAASGDGVGGAAQAGIAISANEGAVDMNRTAPVAAAAVAPDIPGAPVPGADGDNTAGAGEVRQGLLPRQSDGVAHEPRAAPPTNTTPPPSFSASSSGEGDEDCAAVWLELFSRLELGFEKSTTRKLVALFTAADDFMPSLLFNCAKDEQHPTPPAVRTGHCKWVEDVLTENQPPGRDGKPYKLGHGVKSHILSVITAVNRKQHKHLPDGATGYESIGQGMMAPNQVRRTAANSAASTIPLAPLPSNFASPALSSSPVLMDGDGEDARASRLTHHKRRRQDGPHRDAVDKRARVDAGLPATTGTQDNTWERPLVTARIATQLFDPSSGVWPHAPVVMPEANAETGKTVGIGTFQSLMRVWRWGMGDSRKYEPKVYNLLSAELLKRDDVNDKVDVRSRVLKVLRLMLQKKSSLDPVPGRKGVDGKTGETVLKEKWFSLMLEWDKMLDAAESEEAANATASAAVATARDAAATSAADLNNSGVSRGDRPGHS